jgi:hypothetical protein
MIYNKHNLLEVDKIKTINVYHKKNGKYFISISQLNYRIYFL